MDREFLFLLKLIFVCARSLDIYTQGFVLLCMGRRQKITKPKNLTTQQITQEVYELINQCRHPADKAFYETASRHIMLYKLSDKADLIERITGLQKINTIYLDRIHHLEKTLNDTQANLQMKLY